MIHAAGPCHFTPADSAGKSTSHRRPAGLRCSGLGSLSRTPHVPLRVKDSVDDLHGGAIFAADGVGRTDGGDQSGANLGEKSDRQVYFDVQRIDLGQGQDRGLIVGILPGRKLAFDHDTVNRASDRPLIQARNRPLIFQARDASLISGLGQIGLGDSEIRCRFVELGVGNGAATCS